MQLILKIIYRDRTDYCQLTGRKNNYQFLFMT